MNTYTREQIISELESLPDQKIPSLLDYIHFLKKDSLGYQPNTGAQMTMEEDKSSFPTFNSAEDLLESLKTEA